MFDKSKKGFSLVEIVVSISLLGVISALMVPSVKNYQNKLKNKEDEVEFFSLYQKTVSFIVSQEPLWYDKKNMAVVNYPIELTVDSNQELRDLFSISNFSAFLNSWIDTCDINVKDIKSKEYFNADYIDNEFSEGTLILVFNDNSKISFSVYITYDKLNMYLYAKFDSMSYYNSNGILIKEYQL